MEIISKDYDFLISVVILVAGYIFLYKIRTFHIYSCEHCGEEYEEREDAEKCCEIVENFKG